MRRAIHLSILIALLLAFPAGSQAQVPGERLTGISPTGEEIFAEVPAHGLLLIDFFAGWAEPSVIAMRDYLGVIRFYRPHGLSVLGVAPDRDRAVVAYLQRTRQMDWPVIWDPRQQLTRAWEVTELPTSVLINSQGEEVWRGHPLLLAEDLPELLGKATGETVPPFSATRLAENERNAEQAVKTAAGTPVPPSEAQPSPRAQSLLNLAINYERVGRMDLARKNYRDIIRDYPDTPESAKASEALQRLEVVR